MHGMRARTHRVQKCQMALAAVERSIGLEAGALVKRTDKRIYAAKKTGKNRVWRRRSNARGSRNRGNSIGTAFTQVILAEAARRASPP